MRNRPRIFLASLTALLGCGYVAVLYAQAPHNPPEDHPWARFQPGAWRKVRVVSESLDEQGRSVGTSVTESSTYLIDVTETSYALEIETSVEVAGKRLPSAPQLEELQLTGNAVGAAARDPDYKLAGTATYAIDDKRIPCEIYEKTSPSDAGSRVDKIYFAANFVPHILKQEQLTVDADGQTTTVESAESIVAIDMPHKLSNGILPTWQTKLQRKGPKGTTVTIEVHCAEVPGGLVSHSTKELDATGRVIRRSTLELVDFGLESERALERRREFRFRRRR